MIAGRHPRSLRRQVRPRAESGAADPLGAGQPYVARHSPPGESPWVPPDGGRPPGPTVRRAGGGTPVARRARPTGGDGTAQNATALVGTVGAVVGGAVLLRAYGSGAAVLAGLVALLALPGCAVMAWVRTTTVLTRVLGVLSASLTWSILACTALAATTSLTRNS